ncbi:MAG: bifunctional oligoribonuclease/PAP phosphatase NrnA [Bacteroidales bacterium]
MHIDLDIQSLNRLKELLGNSKSIVLISHYNPDGDAVGSILGLYHALGNVGIKSTMVSPNGFPEFLEWLPEIDRVILYSKQKESVANALSNADLIVCLDFNGFRRLETMEGLLASSHCKKILIDHHPEPESPFDLYFSFVQVSSTSELVYEIVAKLYGEQSVDENSAVCLYTGIMTDTGSFSYACSRKRTFEIAGELVARGVNVEAVQAMVYSNFSVNRMQLLGYCLAEKMKVFPEHKAAYIWLTKAELKRFSHQIGDTEGFVNHPLSIKGIIFSVIFMENDGFIKVSLRSRGSFPVNIFSKKYYNGGGHTNAAGGKSFSSLEQTILQFEQLLAEHSSELNSSE